MLSLSAFNWSHPFALLTVSFATKEYRRKFSLNCQLMFFFFLISFSFRLNVWMAKQKQAHKFIFPWRTWASLIQPHPCEPRSFKDVWTQQQTRKSPFLFLASLHNHFVNAINAHTPPPSPLAIAPVSSVTAQVLCIQLADVMISRLKSPSEFYHVETRQV